MESLLKKIILVVVGSFLAFLFLGILESFAGNYLNNTGYFKALAPNITEIYDTKEFTITANISAQGLRNREVSIPKPEEAYRILAIGDSFTFGWGVESSESWPTLLEQSLVIPGRKVEIVNAGIAGASLTDELYVCQAYTKKMDVDAVIIGLFTDDFNQAVTQEIITGKLEKFIKTTWSTLSRIDQTTIGYNLVKNAKSGDIIRSDSLWKSQMATYLDGNPHLLLAIDPDLRNDFAQGKLNPGILARAINSPDYFTFILNPKELEYIQGLVGQSLKRIKDNCTKDLPTTVVFLPASLLVSETYHRYYRQIGYEVNPALLHTDFDQSLREAASQAGMNYISMLTPFRKDGCSLCYYLYDSHLTPFGHQKVTEIISPQLKQILTEWLK